MDKAEFEALIKDLEGELGLLKARYEQWIQGMERVPPMRQKDRLERKLRQLRREQPNNTAMRYRFQAVFARWTTMNTYWQRITRQIEEGTYRRDVKKVKQRRQRIQEQEKRESTRAAAMPDQPLELDLDADLDSELGAALAALEAPTASKSFGRPISRSQRPKPSSTSSARRAPPPPPSAKARPVPPPPPGRRVAPPPPPPGTPRAAVSPPMPPKPRTPQATRSGLSDGDLQRVYDKYVDAKKRNNEPTDKLSRERLARKIRAMEPKLRKKYGSANVDFDVVVKDGRVGLKPKKK